MKLRLLLVHCCKWHSAISFNQRKLQKLPSRKIVFKPRIFLVRLLLRKVRNEHSALKQGFKLNRIFLESCPAISILAFAIRICNHTKPITVVSHVSYLVIVCLPLSPSPLCWNNLTMSWSIVIRKSPYVRRKVLQ